MKDAPTMPLDYEKEALRLEAIAAEELADIARMREVATVAMSEADRRERGLARLLEAARVLRGEVAAVPVSVEVAFVPVAAPSSPTITSATSAAGDNEIPQPGSAASGEEGGAALDVRPDVAPERKATGAPAPLDAAATSATGAAPELPLRGLALGRARAAEPTTRPDCERPIARGQLPQHRGSASCKAIQERRAHEAEKAAREAERAAVLEAAATKAPRGTSGGPVSISPIVACDLCGREIPQHALYAHRDKRPCKARQAENADQRTRSVQDSTAAAPPAPAVTARPRRAEDIPSSIMGQKVAPGDLSGVAKGMTRSIAGFPERVASGGGAIDVKEVTR